MRYQAANAQDNPAASDGRRGQSDKAGARRRHG
jgi:hypothetical protein